MNHGRSHLAYTSETSADSTSFTHFGVAVSGVRMEIHISSKDLSDDFTSYSSEEELMFFLNYDDQEIHSISKWRMHMAASRVVGVLKDLVQQWDDPRVGIRYSPSQQPGYDVRFVFRRLPNVKINELTLNAVARAIGDSSCRAICDMTSITPYWSEAERKDIQDHNLLDY